MTGGMTAEKRKLEGKGLVVDCKCAKTDDPFNSHFNCEFESRVADALLGSPLYSLPSSSTLLEEVGPVRFRQRCTQFPFALSNPQPLEASLLSSKLAENYETVNGGKDSPAQTFIFDALSRYVDLYCASDIPNHMVLYCLHVLNHTIKTKNLVMSNNRRLHELHDKGCLSEEEIEKCRDQGFARPKVLILCPMRKDAFLIVECLRRLLFGDIDKSFVSNFHRFKTEFGDNGYRVNEHKIVSDEYKELMSGNNDDCFRLGIKIAKKGLCLYTAFEKSDIILASPLGIRLTVGDRSEEDRKIGFLSSIEVLIIDKAEIMMMQNWEHLLHVMDSLHCPPEKIEVDLSRIRKWALDQRARLYRQTVVFSSALLAECRALFAMRCFNFAGFVQHIPYSEGLLSKIDVPFSQELRRFEVDNAENQSEERLQFFKAKILPNCSSGTLIFVPSYFDFVKVRNHLKREDESFVQLHEYAKQGQVAKGRVLFSNGKKKIMLLTERFHFYRRLSIKGINSLIFYQPPVIPSFYHEFINMVTVTDRAVVRLIYCIFDADRMKNIFGDTYSEQLLHSAKNAHALVSN